ncbi:hypothetical protein (nucleomorph) [Guillardia theta]|uniref:Uncharacterized protein n=1 Tax=Guillardia theta TaxID=55529 RepID=Q98S51_GUITH|nr:hypothetical protein GTHECHR3088 [Guillardia theta]AAK39732.1 hypothetical protein [Guillardia theta]
MSRIYNIQKLNVYNTNKINFLGTYNYLQSFLVNIMSNYNPISKNKIINLIGFYSNKIFKCIITKFYKYKIFGFFYKNNVFMFFIKNFLKNLFLKNIYNKTNFFSNFKRNLKIINIIYLNNILFEIKSSTSRSILNLIFFLR